MVDLAQLHDPLTSPPPSHHQHFPQAKEALPLLDLTPLSHHHHSSSSSRTRLIADIREACRKFGFFQVFNHGICPRVMDAAVASAADYFKLESQDKMVLASDDLTRPVRYSTTLTPGKDEVLFRREVLKHYSHPLSDWLHLWPSNPHDYREKMGRYSEQVRKLALDLMEAIFESLGLEPTYLKQELVNQGSQMMAVNSYPAEEAALGAPPHSDYGFLTVLLQSGQGLEVLDSEGEWRAVPALPGSLAVHVGDHLEVLSNGAYSSVVHRVALNPEKSRLSVASIFTVGVDTKVGPAPELVDEQHPKAYTESSFADYVQFLSSSDRSGRKFLETLKF